MPDEPAIPNPEVEQPTPPAPVSTPEPTVALSFLKDYFDSLTKGQPVPEPTPTPTATPTPTPAPAATPPAVAPDLQTVPITIAQLQALTAAQTQLNEIQVRLDRESRERQQKDAETALEQGKLKEGLALLRQQKDDEVNAVRTTLAANEERTRRFARDRELATELANHPIVPGALPQLAMLLQGGLNVVPQGDSYAVQTPTLQPTKDYVKEQLSKPEFAHFLQAQNTGGTAGSTGAHNAAPTNPSQPPPNYVPKSFVEGVIMDSLSATRERGGVDPNIPANLQPQALWGIKPVRQTQ